MDKFIPCNKTKELILDRLHRTKSATSGIAGNTTLKNKINVDDLLKAINLDQDFFKENME